MDPRVVPEQFLGANQRIVVYRNAGGRVGPDVVRTVCVLQSIAMRAESVNVLVVHHTGMFSLPFRKLTKNGICEGCYADHVCLVQTVVGCM